MKRVYLCNFYILLFILSCSKETPTPSEDTCRSACNAECVKDGALAGTYQGTSLLRLETIHSRPSIATVVSDTTLEQEEVFTITHLDSTAYVFSDGGFCGFFAAHDICGINFQWWRDLCEWEYDWKYDTDEKGTIIFNQDEKSLEFSLDYSTVYGVPVYDSVTSEFLYEEYYRKTYTLLAKQ